MKYNELTLTYIDKLDKAGEFSTEANVKTLMQETVDKSTRMQLQLRIKDNKIVDTRFKVLGNPHSIAIMAYLSEWLQNKTLADIHQLSSETLIKQFELPRDKYYVALLAEDLLQFLN